MVAFSHQNCDRHPRSVQTRISTPFHTPHPLPPSHHFTPCTPAPPPQTTTRFLRGVGEPIGACKNLKNLQPNSSTVQQKLWPNSTCGKIELSHIGAPKTTDILNQNDWAFFEIIGADGNEKNQWQNNSTVNGKFCKMRISHIP